MVLSLTATFLFQSNITGLTVKSAQKQGIFFSCAISTIFKLMLIVLAMGFKAIAP